MVSPGWGPRHDLCKAALVTDYAVPVLEITSVGTEAGSGQASSRSGSTVLKVSATQRHCRSSQFPPSSSRPVIKGSGISLLFTMENLASSFHKFSSFLFEGWSCCYVPSQGCLWSGLCTLRCMSVHWVDVTPTNHCSILTLIILFLQIHNPALTN